MPHLDWIQVEVTGRCNAQCGHCPRTVYRERWINRDLTLEQFSRLVPFLSRVKMVHLQGWGEPFLNPDIFEMIRLAKREGCRVGTTTNALLLNRENIRRLVGTGIDYIAFSITGLGRHHDLARRGTDFSKTLQAISWIADEKRERHVETPSVSVAYLLLRSQAGDIDNLVPALAGRGIQNIVVSTLDFVSDRELLSESLSTMDEEEYIRLKSMLDRAKAEAEKGGSSLHCNLPVPGSNGVNCTENTQNALVVTSDGKISPCVFLDMPAEGATFIVAGEEKIYSRLTFGSLADSTLPEIWWSQEYRSFRRETASGTFSMCGHCPKRRCF